MYILGERGDDGEYGFIGDIGVPGLKGFAGEIGAPGNLSQNSVKMRVKI